MLINIHEAKTNFSRLIERVSQGEEIVIGKAGKPVARIVPYSVQQYPRQPGGWEGKVWMAPDFEEYDAEIEALFNGSAFDERD